MDFFVGHNMSTPDLDSSWTDLDLEINRKQRQQLAPLQIAVSFCPPTERASELHCK